MSVHRKEIVVEQRTKAKANVEQEYEENDEELERFVREFGEHLAATEIEKNALERKGRELKAETTQLQEMLVDDQRAEARMQVCQ